MSDARPKLRELARELEELSWAEVKAMAIQLDMGFATLRKIEERYREISDRVLSAMETWLDTDKQASWKKLVKALNDTSKIVLAQNIEKKYVLAPAATFTAADATLTSGDAITVVEELLEAQNRSKFLGLKLNLPTHVVEGIHDQYSDPQTRLLHVIEEFLRQVEPRPTWRVIVDALRSPAVNLPRLADKVEAAHFPDPTSTRGVVTETTSTVSASVQAASPSQRPVVVDLPETEEASTSTSVPGPPDTTESSAATTTSDIAEDEVKSKPTSQPIPSSDVDSSVETLKGEIKGLHRLFNRVKESTIKCLKKCQIAVMTVVYLLTSILSVDEHKKFLKEEHKVLRKCEDHWELFGELNLHWNYLSPDLLDQLIDELTLKDGAFESVVEEMTAYKREIHEFRKRTTLKLFCLAVPGTVATPPPGFNTMVTKHNWPDTVTLEDVEKFRIKFMQTFNLQQCAMIVEVIRANSFSITWFVLLSNTVITTLKKCTANIAVFRQYCVSEVVIDGVCVYKTPVQQEIDSLPSASIKETTDISSFEATSAVQTRITSPASSTSVSMATKGLSMGSIPEASTSTSVAGPDTTGSPAATTTSDITEDEGKSKPTSQLKPSSESGSKNPVQSLKSEIDGFHRRFNMIKEATIECLEKCRIAVVRVVFMLTSIIAVDEHKTFLEKNHNELHECKSHWKLFSLLNFYWNYLAYDLLDQLISKELIWRDTMFEKVGRDMAKYSQDMEDFRKRTTLKLFCQVVQCKKIDPPPGFNTMVTEHNWPDTITLKDVEQFRKRFIETFNLQQCAMMVESARPGSFKVTWFVFMPKTAIEMLKMGKGKMAVFRQYCVSEVVIDGVCVYQTPVQQEVQSLPSASVKETTDISSFVETATAQTRVSSILITLSPSNLQVQSWAFASVKETTDISSFEKNRAAARTRITPPASSTSVSMATKGLPTLSMKSTGVSMTTKGLSTLSMKSIPEGQLTVQCYPKKRAPRGMRRGSATTDQQYAYFTPYDFTSVYSYGWNTEQWEELPSCPCRDSALVIIDSELTTVGGGSRFGCTDKLQILRQGQWVEEYPPMKTARSKPAAVSTSDGDYIIVIGGHGHGGWTATVELFQVKTRQWYELKLPQPLPYPSATICGNQVHVIGDGVNGYSCSLQALPSSNEPITPQSLPHLISWKSLPPIPVTVSTAATLCGQLVIIGGRQGGSQVNSIHQLVEGQWVEIGSMTSDREFCLSVSPSPDRVMIVGGQGAKDSIEECVVV